jgi:hypothetical protein
MKTREERERDLVALLISDRPALVAQFRKARNLQPQEKMDGIAEYDLVHLILDSEYRDDSSDAKESARWMAARSSM